MTQSERKCYDMGYCDAQKKYGRIIKGLIERCQQLSDDLAVMYSTAIVTVNCRHCKNFFENDDGSMGCKRHPNWVQEDYACDDWELHDRWEA